MLFYLFLLLTLVPLAELVVLIRIGQLTDTWVPIALVIVTGIVGTGLARWQGLQALGRIREDARAGRVPAGAIIDGVLILVAGILLVTPGVFTDLFGLALLIPPLRALMKRAVAAWIRHNVEVRVSRASAGYWSQANSGPHGTRRDEIIDVKVLNKQVEDADENHR
jgi:UPF0716 protein FxsA